jgi:hypothetical protein
MRDFAKGILENPADPRGNGPVIEDQVWVDG